jgi:hypothetical protein
VKLTVDIAKNVGGRVQPLAEKAVAATQPKPSRNLKIKFTVTKRSYPGGKIEEIIAEQIP